MAQWIIRQKDNMPGRDSDGVPFAIKELIRSRGISEDNISDFLSDNPKETYDPFLFTGIDEASDIMLNACDSGRDIVIYGDYDADGVTSTALLYEVLRNFLYKVDYYIPSRFSDGYGLNNDAIKRISEKHPGALLISVDCGSTSKPEVEYAKSLGLDVIITDHHNFEEEKTPDTLIINPKLPGNSYPFKGLSGCGVAFKIAQAIERKCAAKGDSRFTKSQLNALLDLVAISTIADVVPLVSENRSLVKYGLAVVNKRQRRGLAALLDVLDIQSEVKGDDVAYILAPNINALGRMGSAQMGVELLSGANKSMAELYDLATAMQENNKKRKKEQSITAKICDEAMKAKDCGRNFLVIETPGAHEGVAGIVAGNLKEKFYKPVFVLTPNNDGSLKGTGRCIPGINLHELMAKHSDLFIRFGGHAGACGFTMEKDKVEELRAAMQDEIDLALKENPDILTEKLYIEKELSKEEMSLDFARMIERLQPFGEANPRPYFCVMHATAENIFMMGQEHQHMRFNAVSRSGQYIPCVLFRDAQEFLPYVDNNSIFDVAGELSVNEYGGRSRLQMIVKDIRRSQN